MLSHMGLKDQAEKINKAVFKTIAEGKFLTGDLGGKASTKDFTQAIIDHLGQ